jgi:hypothetical protein
VRESAASLLRKSLRRHRDGALPDWSLRNILQRELNRLVSDHSALRPEMDELRRVAPGRLTGFDTASDRALQWLGECRFDLALREIQEAERDLAELRLCLTVAVDWRRTSATLAGLEELLSPELAAQATVRVLQRLRHLARSLLDHGETRKARFVVLLLADQTGRLLARRPEDLKAGFERMLGRLETQAGMAVDHIRKLNHEGYHRLAERLAEDLEVELSMTDRARRASTVGGSLGAIESDLAAVRRRAQEVQAALTQWLESGS